MLSSKKVPLEFQVKPKKFKKYHKIKIKNSFNNYTSKKRDLIFSASNTCVANGKQLVAVLKIVKPEMKISSKRSRLKLYTKVDTILTQKPKDIRMGRGKGVPIDRVALIQNGHTIFKLKGVSSFDTLKIYEKCSPKFVTKIKYINTKQW